MEGKQKTRHVQQLVKLPAGELTDDELLRVFMRRFEAQGVALFYVDAEGCHGMSRSKTATGRRFIKDLGRSWDAMFSADSWPPLSHDEAKYCDFNCYTQQDGEGITCGFCGGLKEEAPADGKA